jgi:hypothetical protein
MKTAAPGSVACLLCGGRALTPVLHPPLVRCRGCGLVFRDVPDGGRQVARGFEEVYRRADADRLVQARRVALYEEFLARHAPSPGRTRLLERGVHLVVRAIAAGSRGRLLLGSSLSATALKGGAA